MKGIFRRLGFRGMDEMERHIAFRAQRNAYFFLVAALLAWSFYESYQAYAYHERINPVPCGLLGAAALIQGFSQLAMTRNAVKGDEDSYETAPLLGIVILVCIAAGVAATIGAAIVLMGVRA